MLIRQVGRFALVGFAVTAIHIATVVMLVELFSWFPPAANVTGFILAFAAAYIANHQYTFALKGAHKKHFYRFLVLSGSLFGLNHLLFYSVTEILGMPYRVALALVVTIIPLLSFTGMRLWVFAMDADD